MSHTPTERFGTPMTALAVTNKDTALAVLPQRLCWKGIAVTDEFQAYAARVARGEQLAPYRGQVLSRPSREFPWSVAPQPSPPPPRASLPPVAFGVREQADAPPTYPERGRSLKTALWVAAAVSSIIGALGVGAGATSSASDEREFLAPYPTQGTQAPPKVDARAEALASDVDTARELEGWPIGESALAPLAAISDDANSAMKGSRHSTGARPATASTSAQRTSTTSTTTASGTTSTSARSSSSSAEADATEADATATESSAELLAIPPSPRANSSEMRRSTGIVTTARPDDALASGRSSSLFSDHSPF